MAKANQLPNYKWIKFNIDRLNDPDFMQLPEGASGVYLKLYLIAGRADAAGLIANETKIFSSKDIAFFLHLSHPITESYLSELCQTGLLVPDGEGFRIAHFLDEQGPGMNETERAKWRERTNRRRAKLKNEEFTEQPSSFLDQEKDKEGEKELESHGDVTVTSETVPPPLSSEPSKDHPAIVLWKKIVYKHVSKNDYQEIIDGLGENPDESKLKQVMDEFRPIAEQEGWSATRPATIIDWYYGKRNGNGRKRVYLTENEIAVAKARAFLCGGSEEQHIQEALEYKRKKATDPQYAETY